MLKAPMKAWARSLAPALLGTLALVFAAVPIMERLSAPPVAQAFEFPSPPPLPAVAPPDARPVYREHALDAGGQPMVHSATLALVPDGNDLLAWWYAGTREGARDVALHTARWDAAADTWSPAREMLTRARAAAGLGRHLKKLGNPVAFLAPDDRLWLFFVSVSVGGWAGSAINYTISRDGGATFGPIRRLTTSPFLNISTLVRSPPVALRGGALALPVYHEFLGKFAEVLFLDPDGRVRDKRRISWGRDALQPVLVPTGAKEALVFMRHAGPQPRRVLRARTHNAGRTFTRPRPTTLPNPDAAVAGGLVANGAIALIYNPSSTARNALSLATASPDDDYERWTRLHDFERAPQDSGRHFAYPAWLRDRQGRFHAVWSHQRRHIRHVMFNQAWIDAVAQEPQPPTSGSADQ